MKKMLRALLMAVMTICFCVPAFGSAEAATVALLPLVNNVQDDLANQIFYKEAMAKLNSQKGFVLVENDTLSAAIADVHGAMGLPTENALKHIAEAGKVDIVIAMELNKLDSKVRRSKEENKVFLDLKAKAVAYNAITGVYYAREISPSVWTPEATTARWDWEHEQFGRAVRQEIERILKAK